MLLGYYIAVLENLFSLLRLEIYMEMEITMRMYHAINIIQK